MKCAARHFWLAALVFLGYGIFPVLAKEFPAPNGRVNDFAGILQATTRQTLEQKIAALERATTAELAVVTVQSLEGTSVEDYANRLFRQWGIGKKGKDNGVLILVAPKEHRVRIEVGYGLEAILPDGLAGDIIRNQMTPAFKAGDFDGGILKGTQRVIEILTANQPAAAGQRIRYRHGGSYRPTFKESLGLIAFFSVFVGIGFFMLGAGLGSKTVFPIVWGSLFGGLPLFMSMAAAGGMARTILAPWGFLLLLWGIHIGRKPKNFLSQSRMTGVHTDGWTWGASSSGGGGDGGGGGFSGGSSGGGGASGSW